MKFKEALDMIVENVDDTIAALIVGTDGIIIEKSIIGEEDFPQELNLDLIAAEKTSLLKSSLRTADDIDIGELEELNLFTEKYCFLIKLITREYYFLVIMKRSGTYGKSRFLLKKAKLILEKEFII